jgi:hypothetical protein
MPDKTMLYPKFRGELIPFDVQKALKGAPVVISNGYQVEGLRMAGNQLHGVVQGQICNWGLDGTFPIPGPAARILDLHIGVPQKVTFFTRLSARLENFLLGSNRRVA